MRIETTLDASSGGVLADIGLGDSREAVEGLADDPDFQVRFEVAAALRR